MAPAQPPSLLDQASRLSVVLFVVRGAPRPLRRRTGARRRSRRVDPAYDGDPMTGDRATDDRTAAVATLHEEADACRRCAIGSTRTKVVCGVGDPRARLVVIGEGPGENEDRLGAPFVGRAGELLTKMLAAIELRRDDVFITNTIKCRA